MYKEYASKQFVEEYFKNQNISSVSTPDWNENDENSSSYIKNRTHWEEVSWEEVLPLTTVDGFTAVGENGVYSAYYEMPALDNNSFYSIKFDGVEYFGLGGSLMSSNVANGNAPTTENEAPFCFVEEYLGAGTYNYYVYVYADGESHTFDILKHVGDIHKIDKKFLPTLIGSKTYNNGEIFNNAMNASYYAHAEGFETIASGNSSHAEGYGSTASGWSSHSENYLTTASGNYSHAEGWYTEASGNGSHAEGYGSTASGNSSHAEGGNTEASGHSSHAEGSETIASGSYSHAECGGNSAPAMTFSSAYYPIIGSNDIEISNTTAYGESSHAEGGNTFAYGEFSHAEGINTGALGECSHAEGECSIALGKYSHAEGVNVQATGNWSHAEGGNTEASGYSSHAEGFISVASGNYSHAEGRETIASGTETHTEGLKTTASGKRSHAEGWGTIANSDDQHVQGRYNISDSENKYLHIVGNGNQNMDGVRSNAHILDWNGNAWFAGDVYVGSTSGTNKDEGSKKLATEEFVDSKVVQPDWNQNDETAPDYVKNRPGGYYTEALTEEVEETTVTINSDGGFSSDMPYFTPKTYPNSTYVVIFDGVEYRCTAYPSAGPYLGVLGVEPFKFINHPTENEWGVYCETAGKHTFTVYEVVETPVPIDEKFLPDSINSHTHSWNDLQDKPFGDNADGTVNQMSGKYVEGMGYKEAKKTVIFSGNVEMVGKELGDVLIAQGTVPSGLSSIPEDLTITVDGVSTVIKVDVGSFAYNGKDVLVGRSKDDSGNWTNLSFFSDGNTDYTIEDITIEAVTEIIHPIDEKFLPDTVATKADIEAHNTSTNTHADIRQMINSIPSITYGTEDLVAGESELAEGVIYFVYE